MESQNKNVSKVNTEEITGVRNAVRYDENPFLNEEVIKIKKGVKSEVIGSTNQMLLNRDTGEVNGIALMHKQTIIDRDKFIKIYISEVSSLLDLSKSGLKVFGYILQSLQPQQHEIYIYFPDLLKACAYKSKNQAYKGLFELVKNKIIALSHKPNIWYINPNILFNGDRIAFVKEYKLESKPVQIQSNIDFDKEGE